MLCNKCGSQYNGRFCPHCGTPSQAGVTQDAHAVPNNPPAGGNFCQRCGAPFSGSVCNNCGTPAVPVQSPLVWAILSTICCCLPFGIVSIVYASKVNTLVAAGAYGEAQEAAAQSIKWAWIAFGVGFVVNIILLALQIVGTMAENGNF